MKHFANAAGVIYRYRTLVPHEKHPAWVPGRPKGTAKQEHLYTVVETDGSLSDRLERWLDVEFEAPVAPVICCMCHEDVEPLATGPKGWRVCDDCAPRPHRVTMTYVPRVNIYTIGFLAEDAKTSLGWPYTVEGEEALRRLVERGHGDLEELEEQLEMWGQGCVDLHLTERQYKAPILRNERKPPRSSRGAPARSFSILSAWYRLRATLPA